MCAPGQGIETFSGLRARGRSRRSITSAVEAGELRHLRRGVYAERGACAPVVTAALHGGRAACVTAARHLGLWTLAAEQPIHVWMRGGGHAYAHDECTCRLHWDDAAPGHAFALPSVPRILRQILRCRGVEDFFVSVESALRLGMLTSSGKTWLRSHTNDVARDALDFARSDADSGLESIVRWRLRHRNLPVRTQMHIISVGRVDLLIGDALIIEIDGAGNHEGAANRHRDLRRDAHAAAWGFVSLRFDYALVVHDWPTVERAIMAYVERGLHLAR
ncbi:DUF559 domain-containing protein [Microbacterium sp. CFBP 8794]|nr:DUF559 domain-containing protein [Microbacterium sp. CFBP 8794]